MHLLRVIKQGLVIFWEKTSWLFNLCYLHKLGDDEYGLIIGADTAQLKQVVVLKHGHHFGLFNEVNLWHGALLHHLHGHIDDALPFSMTNDAKLTWIENIRNLNPFTSWKFSSSSMLPALIKNSKNSKCRSDNSENFSVPSLDSTNCLNNILCKIIYKQVTMKYFFIRALYFR